MDQLRRKEWAHNLEETSLIHSDTTQWKLLLKEEIFTNGNLNKIQKETFNFPKYFKRRGKYILTCIKINDKWEDGTGGVPCIIDGGVNHKFVSISLQSQYHRGFRFSIEIYGLKETLTEGNIFNKFVNIIKQIWRIFEQSFNKRFYNQQISL